MTGQLTYHQARPKGFDPINDPVDWLLDCLPEVSFETALQLLLFCLLDLL